MDSFILMQSPKHRGFKLLMVYNFMVCQHYQGFPFSSLIYWPVPDVSVQAWDGKGNACRDRFTPGYWVYLL
jgi:hypothetical protein